jgi:hypothetical protein
MVGELHKRGYQKLRIMPYMAPTGAWRCSIAPVILFYRNHGAMHVEPPSMAPDITEPPAAAMVARYSGAVGNRYFDWDDATTDSARQLADKFIERFPVLADCGKGWDYLYAGWFQRLLGYAERGWLPYLFAEYENASPERVYLQDFRPDEWRPSDEEPPVLPLPSPGQWPEDHRG